MTKDDAINHASRRAWLRSRRAWRPWLWALASWLKQGAIALAFYLALRTGSPGVAALAVLLAGLSLSFFLDASSQGD